MNFNQWYSANFVLSRASEIDTLGLYFSYFLLHTTQIARFKSVKKFLNWKTISKEEEKILLEIQLRRTTNERTEPIHEFPVCVRVESTKVLTEQCFITLTLIRSTKSGLTCSVTVFIQIFTRCSGYYDVCVKPKLLKCQCEHMWQAARSFDRDNANTRTHMCAYTQTICVVYDLLTKVTRQKVIMRNLKYYGNSLRCQWQNKAFTF